MLFTENYLDGFCKIHCFSFLSMKTASRVTMGMEGLGCHDVPNFNFVFLSENGCYPCKISKILTFVMWEWRGGEAATF